MNRSRSRASDGISSRSLRLRAFLHDVAELSGKYQLAGARHATRLDEQDIATDRRPRKPCRDPGDARAHRHFAFEALRPEDRREVAFIDADAFVRAFRDAH